MSAQRMKEYREKLKLPGNEKLLDERKEKIRISNANYRLKKKNCPEFRKKKAEGKKLRRHAIKKAAQKASFASEGNFNSSRELKKAVNQSINALPKSNGKGKTVWKEVGKILDITSLDDLKKSQNRAPNDRVQQVIQFYQHDEISRQLPGKMDFVIIREKGIKHKIQKREMLMTLGDAHKKFVKDFPGIPISMSHFTSMRPKQVVSFMKARHNVCCCVYCENMKLFFDVAKRFLKMPGEFKTINDILRFLVSL